MELLPPSKLIMEELDLQQIPLSKVDSVYLQKKTLSFDIDKKKFLDSNLINPNHYKNIIFSDDEIFFISKGFYKNNDPTYYDARLNRLTGELIRVAKATESYVKMRLETKNADFFVCFTLKISN